MVVGKAENESPGSHHESVPDQGKGFVVATWRSRPDVPGMHARALRSRTGTSKALLTDIFFFTDHYLCCGIVKHRI